MVCRLRLAPRIVTAVHSHPHEQITLVERGSVRVHHRRPGARSPRPATSCTSRRTCGTAPRCSTRRWCSIDIFSPIREDFLPAATAAERSRWCSRPVPPRRQGGAGDRRLARAGRRRWRAALAAAGADVVLHASERAARGRRRRASPTRTGRRTAPLTADLAQRRRRRPPRRRDAIAAFGRIDILVNNAGTIRRAAGRRARRRGLGRGDRREPVERVPAVPRRRPAHDRRAAGRQDHQRRVAARRSRAASPCRATRRPRAASRSSPRRWPTSGRAHRINVNAIAPGYMETDNTAALRADADARPPDRRAHSGRPLGHARGSGRRGGVPGVARPPTTCTATCWSSTAAGWAGDDAMTSTAATVPSTSAALRGVAVGCSPAGRPGRADRGRHDRRRRRGDAPAGRRLVRLRPAVGGALRRPDGGLHARLGVARRRSSPAAAACST